MDMSLWTRVESLWVDRVASSNRQRTSERIAYTRTEEPARWKHEQKHGLPTCLYSQSAQKNTTPPIFVSQREKKRASSFSRTMLSSPKKNADTHTDANELLKKEKEVPSDTHQLTCLPPIGLLSSHSYEVSDKDVEAFNALPSGPNEASFPHAARWYKHIAAVKGLSAKYAMLSPHVAIGSQTRYLAGG